MPTYPARPCPYPRCPYAQPCPIHTTPTYNYGKQHKRWRSLVLQRAGYRCSIPGCQSLAIVADHILPISRGGQAFALANGQSLCIHHHNQKTRRDEKRIGVNNG
jgi:5-methylcytosine-specific restriction endonuclease McrA